MEVKGATLLYTLAGLMVTFAGFSALLLGLRQAAGARLSMLDRFLAKTVVTQLGILTAAALLPPLLALYDIPESAIWRVAAVMFTLAQSGFLLSFPHRRRKAVGAGPPTAVFWIFVVFGTVVMAAMLVYVLAGLHYAAAAYVTALIVNLGTLAFAFITALDVIMRQPAEDRPR